MNFAWDIYNTHTLTPTLSHRKEPELARKTASMKLTAFLGTDRFLAVLASLGAEETII
jgi:hypothetical protein